MTAFFVAFSLVGLGLFYLQNLVLFPQVRLRLLELLAFYAGLSPSLPLAVAVALTLGFLQDCYASTPFGLHLVASLALVAAARFSRRHFLLQRLLPQVVASLGALALQELVLQVTLFLTGARKIWLGEVAFLEILCTAALAPLIFALLKRLGRCLNRLGWRMTSSAS
jgi:rod shape-determining protein MreD